MRTVRSRKCLLTIFTLLTFFVAVAQKPRRSVFYTLIQQKRQHGVYFHNTSLFTRNHQDFKLNKDKRAGAIGTGLHLNKYTIAALFRAHHEAIVLAIPSADGTTYTLDLTEQKLNVSGDFSTGSIATNFKRSKTSSDQGLHYRGYVEGDSTSMAVISLFANGELMGLFSNQMGNFNIGEADSTGSNYVVYNSNDLDMPAPFICGDAPPVPSSSPAPMLNSIPPLEAVPSLLCKKARVYFEGSYNLYSYNFHSNLVATQNYLMGLFNQVAALYQNEGIMVELSETYVWTTPDPYDTSSSTNSLLNFQSRWNALNDNFNGDIAHLVSGGTTNNGGIAYLLPDLCDRPYNYGYSNVYGYYNNVPTYSWDVNVVTHEMGHNFGSHHTHWCGWNTGAGSTCGAIDNCYTEEASYDNHGTLLCSSCPALTDTATRPVGWQGTIMSYCHLTAAIGINLANGFGPLPQAVIRNAISSSSCLTGTVESWSGTTSTAWEDATNWSCGSVPDTNTVVTISQSAPNMPVINSSAKCESLTAPSGTSVQVNSGDSLEVAGVGTINTN